MKSKKLNKKSGFTLLEIIVVIIIVGVLASLALPRFFSTVEYSRSTEALNAMGVIRESVIRCGMVANDVQNCDVDGNNTVEFSEMDVDDPGTVAGAHFTYVTTVSGVDDYIITATRNNVDGGDGTSTILFTVVSGAVTRTGTGSFGSIG